MVALRPHWDAIDGRIDLRNHRKIVVIDNAITYCGSQNCADPAFLPKAKFGPWVDILMRFEGPVVRQNQHLFATDWAESTSEDLSNLLRAPLVPTKPGFAAQVIGTASTARYSAMPEVFENLIYAARQQLFVTTPYYVPNSSIQGGAAPPIAASTRRSSSRPATTLAVGATCQLLRGSAGGGREDPAIQARPAAHAKIADALDGRDRADRVGQYGSAQLI